MSMHRPWQKKNFLDWISQPENLSCLEDIVKKWLPKYDKLKSLKDDKKAERKDIPVLLEKARALVDELLEVGSPIPKLDVIPRPASRYVLESLKYSLPLAAYSGGLAMLLSLAYESLAPMLLTLPACGYFITRLAKKNVSVWRMHEKSMVSGYFRNRNEIRIKTGPRERVLSVMIHEYSHAVQSAQCKRLKNPRMLLEWALREGHARMVQLVLGEKLSEETSNPLHLKNALAWAMPEFYSTLHYVKAVHYVKADYGKVKAEKLEKLKCKVFDPHTRGSVFFAIHYEKHGPDVLYNYIKKGEI